MIVRGDALELIQAETRVFDLIVTDPPYAFGGNGDEHALSAAVAVVLRETARRLRRGRWMVVFSASSWRSTEYMVESVRGILTPVRIGSWCKPTSRTKTRTAGWRWATVHAIAFRKGKGAELELSDLLDHITAPPVTRGRRAQLPAEVADWAVRPFAVPGGLMLDPFAGSGELLEAAARAGMSASGYERHPEMMTVEGYRS